MPRPQFTLKTLLWLTLVVAALFGGREWGIRHERQKKIDKLVAQQVRLRDALARRVAAQIKDANRLRSMLEKRTRDQVIWEALRDHHSKTHPPEPPIETDLLQPQYR